MSTALGYAFKVHLYHCHSPLSTPPPAASILKLVCHFLVLFRNQVKHIKHDGNVTLDQVIDIARTMRERSMARSLAGTVKEMLGTCNSVGCTVNGASPRDIQVRSFLTTPVMVYFSQWSLALRLPMFCCCCRTVLVSYRRAFTPFIPASCLFCWIPV